MRLNHGQKETILETIREQGTLKSGAKVANISVDELKEERRKSAIFRKRLSEALSEGKQNLADRAIEKLQEYAFNPPEKTDRNVLTAAIALANAYEPGFRGTSKVEGRIEHDVRVITAVPRPNYQISERVSKRVSERVIEVEKKQLPSPLPPPLDKPPDKVLK